MNTSNCWKLCQNNSLSAAETFNNYFCEVARSDRDCREMVEFVKVAAEKTRDNCFNLVPVDVSYIRKIWGTLDPRKATATFILTCYCCTDYPFDQLLHY